MTTPIFERFVLAVGKIPQPKIKCQHCGETMPYVGWHINKNAAIYEHPNDGFVQQGRIPCAIRNKDLAIEWDYDAVNNKLIGIPR